MDLTIYFEKIVRNFTRYHNYTLGSELREKSREIVGLIIKANSTVEKLPGRKTGTNKSVAVAHEYGGHCLASHNADKNISQRASDLATVMNDRSWLGFLISFPAI